MEVSEEIEKSIKLLNKDYRDIKTFNGVTPVYPFNTEDAVNVFFAYREFIKNKKVLTVTGSGDSLLDLIVKGSRDITCFDVNVLAKYIATLKLAFWKSHLDDEEENVNLYKRFFSGVHCGDPILDYGIFKECRPFLDPRTLHYFESLYEYMRKNGIKITNADSTILYAQYDNFIHFPVQNTTVDNIDSYLGKRNRKLLISALADSEDLHIKFLDKDVMDLSSSLSEYYFIYLSNIFEFTSTFLPQKRLRIRLERFKKHILNELKPHLSDGGVLVLGYLQGSKNFSDDVYYDESKYSLIFSENDGFLVDDAYGCRGKPIITANKKVLHKRKNDMYDFY